MYARALVSGVGLGRSMRSRMRLWEMLLTENDKVRMCKTSLLEEKGTCVIENDADERQTKVKTERIVIRPPRSYVLEKFNPHEIQRVSRPKLPQQGRATKMRK